MRYAGATICTAGVNVQRVQLQGLFSAPISFFLSMPAGRIVNRFSSVSARFDLVLEAALLMFAPLDQDTQQMDFAWPISAVNIVSIAGQLVGSLVFIYLAVSRS